MDHQIVIVGAGMAGGLTASELREAGYDGRIVLVGDEHREPYERPKLSKEYLRGEVPAEALAVHPRETYEQAGIELVLGRRAVDLRPGEGRVLLDDGSALGFDRGLVLATGLRAIRPPLRGAGLPGVHVLRTVEDADAIRVAATRAHHAIVVGGGWIAAETAASLRQLGLDVTLVVPGSVVLERALGPEVGGLYSQAHAAHGVRLVTRSRAVSIEGIRHATGVRLDTGRLVRGDLVVLGVGAAADLALAHAAGLEVGDGIFVDDRLRTAAPGILAVGDVATAFHARYGRWVRTEHWDGARRQARIAAAQLAGHDERDTGLPYFFSDQFELGMECFGLSRGIEDVVVRRGPADDAFAAFWLDRGRLVAALHVNLWDLAAPLRAAVEAGSHLDRALLDDPSVPLSVAIAEGDIERAVPAA
ncbi:MAG TPA: FAD-dependent oxidoreductase [Candidatus Limnocylindrales bacterium]